MKLLYIHQYFKFPRENGGTRSFDLAQSFRKENIDVEIISATSSKEYKNKRWTRVEEDGLVIHFIYLPYNNEMSYRQRIFVFLKFLYYATRKALKIKTDLVLATSTPLTIGIPAMVKKWRHKTPFIFEVRDVWPEVVIAIGVIKNKFLQKLMLYLENKIYKNAAAIVPLSVDMKKSIVTRFPNISKEKPILVIENISEIQRFTSKHSTVSLPEKIETQPRFSILYAGTFGKVNNIQYVLDLAEKTYSLDSTIAFILVGDGGEKEDIIECAKEKDLLQKNVFILPSIPKSELSQWYNAVDMGSSFVLPKPELWANSANKFFDSLAAGKPVLINHGGWQAEKIKKEKIGYVLPTKITSDDVKAFIAYTKDDKKMNEHSKHAKNVALSDYSLDIAVKKYLSIIHQILPKNV